MAEEAYCMKCKAKQKMKDEKYGTNKKGLKVVQGICSVCGTKMYKILGK